MLAGSVVMLSALLAALSSPAAALTCDSLNRESLVNIYPPGDITIRYGDPLEIYCSVEPPFTSSVLKFSRKSRNSLDLVTHDAQIVNETTARIYIPLPERQSSMYDCEVIRNVTDTHLPTYCSNTVVVDQAPDNITDFYCRSYNLQRLECKWQVPVQYIKTEYTLSYEMYDQTTNCKVQRKGDTYFCLFLPGDMNNGSVYRNQEDYYNFNLTSSNRFGSTTQFITLDHFAVLIPEKPTKLDKENITAHSVLLRWQIPRDIADFSHGVNHRIWYQIKTVDVGRSTWRSADLTGLRNFNKTTYLYKLQGLPHAHWSYDVRVFIKSIRAPDVEEFWSEFAATTFTTLSEPPPRPPRTEVGAFQANKRDTLRDISIFWQTVEDFDESGDNFTYTVMIGDTLLQSNKSSSARFNTSQAAVNVSITSVNNYGSSSNKSYIYVPAEANMLLEPTSFTKTAFGNKTYDLRWHRPQHTALDSYTVFWCYNTDNTEQCTGRLNFTKLSPKQTSYRVMVPDDDKTYLFAISANRGELSSGMVWASCNLRPEHAKNKVTVFKRDLPGRTSVKLEWSLGCSYSEGHVIGYKITYCLLPRHEVSDCSGRDDLNLTINNPLQTNVNMTNLMPYSTYIFRIAVIYKDGIGYNSEYLDATMLEDKPSEPLNVKISHVNASSMKVSWDPPVLKNGIIRKYLVRYRINDDPNSEKEVLRDMSTQIKDKQQEGTQAKDERQENTQAKDERQEVTQAKDERQKVTQAKDERQEITQAKDQRQKVTQAKDERHQVTQAKDERQKVTQAKDERQEVTLTGLDAFTNYTVDVLACTTDCTVTEAGQVRTAIGAPSKIDKPFFNTTTQRLQWKPPRVPGGTLDLYQIRISNKDKKLISPIINITSTGPLEHKVPQCNLEISEPKLYYSVVAINYDKDKEHGMMAISGNVTLQSYENETWNGKFYESELSEPTDMNCMSTSPILFWILGFVTAVVFMIMFVLGSRKVWIRLKTMTDIGPVLPPGLGPIDEKDSKYQLGGSWSPPAKSKDEKSFPAVAGDEVLLLPPPRRAGATKDLSDSTDSTTLSLTSKEPLERDAATSDDTSDDSSVHEVAPAEPPAPPAPQCASSGYKTFATQPTIQEYSDDDYGHDADSICSDDFSDAPLPSGYVQSAILPPPPPRLDIPSGYVRAQDAPPSVSFPPPVPTPKPMVQENPLMPKFLPMEWKLTPERGGGELGGKTANCAPLAPVKPSGGYVSHADAVIDKHLNIISNNHLGEEPALPDPNMSPEAYCRFAWNPDAGADNNLHSLLSEQAPTAPAQSLFVLQAPKD